MLGAYIFIIVISSSQSDPWIIMQCSHLSLAVIFVLTNIQGNSHKVTVDVSKETLQARNEWHYIFKVMIGKNLQPRILYPAKFSFRFYGEIKTFPDKQKLREFSIMKQALQQMLKELFQAGNTRQGKALRQINPKQLRKW